MDIKVHVTGQDNVIGGLRAMINEIPRASQTFLDRAAADTRDRMSNEAPYRTGALSKNIDISVPSRFVRHIEPIARNIRPGNKYALPVETGSNPRGIPNVFSISTYFGVDMKVAFAIAKSIQDRGTPANPFVGRTYNWVRTQIDSNIVPFVRRLTSTYETY